MEKKIEKIKKMFLIIKNEKLKNGTLSDALNKVSFSFNIKKESAKNFYYKSLKFLNENTQMAKEHNINLDILKTETFKKFSEDEKINLVNFVDQNLLQGISIRQSCLMLANNDAKQMLRLQNKYRNIKKLSLKQKNKTRGDKNMNVINITKAKDKLNKKISDNEINALFMGLIRIVKKAAMDSANNELKTECDIANENFRQTIIDLNKKEAELKRVQEVNIELKEKVESQQKQICLLLDKLSKRKLGSLEKKSESRYSKLKNFDKDSKKNNIL